MISHIALLLYMKSVTNWHVRCVGTVHLNARIWLLSQCLACSVGCWRAFCETEGLSCRVGREPGILMIFFSGCITISLEVPSVHQGHAIHCRECAIGGMPFSRLFHASRARLRNKDESGRHIKDKTLWFLRAMQLQFSGAVMNAVEWLSAGKKKNILWTQLEVLNHLFAKSFIADIICGGSRVYLILFMHSLGQCCF